ncbi:MAG: hypothetical protein ACYSYT_06640, partial [Planctomycetota bacterium]
FTQGDYFPSALIEQTLSIIEDEIFNSEWEELGRLFSEFKEISPVVADACYERIRRSKGNSFLIKGSADGSIILIGLVAGLAFWIVKNTIGESFKKAYQKSQLNERLTNFFLTRIGGKSEELRDNLQKRFFRPISDPKVITDVSLKMEPGEYVIDVRVILKDKRNIPPKLSEVVKSLRDYKSEDLDE